MIESKFSPYLDVPWGVPQGSILGPLLFIIFIMELSTVVKQNDNDGERNENENENNDNDENTESEIIIYADDNTPTTSANDPNDLQNYIQNDSNKVIQWFDANDMVTSADKTKLLIVGTKRNRLNKLDSQNKKLNVNVNNEVKEETESEKLLGVIINNCLNWKSHLYGNEEELGLIKTLSKRIGILSKLRHYLPDKKFKQVAESLFINKLIYGMTVWGHNLTKKEIGKLQVLENKCLRLICHCGYDTPRIELLRKCNQLSVKQLIMYHTAVQTQRIFTSHLPVYHYRTLFSHIRPQRNNTANYIDYRRCISKNQFFYQASTLWNSLPAALRSIQKKESFKKLLKPWIRDNIDPF